MHPLLRTPFYGSPILIAESVLRGISSIQRAGPCMFLALLPAFSLAPFRGIAAFTRFLSPLADHQESESEHSGCGMTAVRMAGPVKRSGFRKSHRVLQGAPPRGRQLYFTFAGVSDPFFKASKAPFLTLRVATPSGAPRQGPLEKGVAGTVSLPIFSLSFRFLPLFVRSLPIRFQKKSGDTVRETHFAKPRTVAHDGAQEHATGCDNPLPQFRTLSAALVSENAKRGGERGGKTSRGDPPWKTVSDPLHLGTFCPPSSISLNKSLRQSQHFPQWPPHREVLLFGTFPPSPFSSAQWRSILEWSKLRCPSTPWRKRYLSETSVIPWEKEGSGNFSQDFP